MAQPHLARRSVAENMHFAVGIALGDRRGDLGDRVSAGRKYKNVSVRQPPRLKRLLVGNGDI